MRLRAYRNAACGDGNLRLRRWPIPRAALPIPARGVFGPLLKGLLGP